MESRCQVRPALPAPAAGALPLPASLDPKLLGFQPGSVEDLNSILGEGLQSLVTPPDHPNVRLMLHPRAPSCPVLCLGCAPLVLLPSFTS